MSDTVLLAVVTLNLIVQLVMLYLQVKHAREHRYPQRWANTTESYLGSDVGGMRPVFGDPDWNELDEEEGKVAEVVYGDEEDTDED